MKIISDEEAEKACDYMRDNAAAAAQARANRAYVEEYRKSIKAAIMKENASAPLGAQERDAYADPRYIAHLQAIKEAVEIDEKYRFLMAAAEAKLSAWQTLSANERGARP